METSPEPPPFSVAAWDELPLSDTRRGLAGVGGQLKQEPDDFEVEEIPAYEPVGDGEHLFLWIEKRDTSGEQLTWRIARHFDIKVHDIGVAGIKDRRAVTRQYVSIPERCAEQVSSFEDEGVRILQARRHRNKLRRGHLRGNRFSILLRQVAPDALAKAEAIVPRIRRHGFPNYFGSQRFGVESETLRQGYELLCGLRKPRDLPPSRRRFLLSLSLSAVQSFLFNLALAERIQDELLRRVLAGDVMQVVVSGGPFVVEDVNEEQLRYEAGETVLTGPIYGPKMKSAAGEPGEREQRLLAEQGLDEQKFLRFPKLTSGTRRPFLVHPQDFTVEAEPDGLRVRFCLPSGTYATSLLRELMHDSAEES